MGALKLNVGRGGRLNWIEPGRLTGLCETTTTETHSMKIRSTLCLPILAGMVLGFAIGTPTADAAPAQPPPGFEALFNGRDLNGWHGMGHFDPRKLWAMTDEERAQMRSASMNDVRQHWSVESGELVNDGNGQYLTTDKEYGDIELLIDYKTVALADSGIYLRGNPQVQIWDFTKEGGKWNLGADKGSGGLWNNSAGAPGKDPLVLADKPFGEWNHLRIIQVGSRTSVWLNDKPVVDNAVMENFWDRSKPLWPKGPIQLQTHGGEIRWRNIFIHELTSNEANEYLASHSDKGFESVFNGKDFDGWAGPLDNYEIQDGAIACKAHQGGTIFTKETYGNFSVRFEFQLPPAGNNGLAIRYPGDGDTAYAGMCEVQVLDDTAPVYKNLDPRQFNGSAYGMVASQRGFLRPVGEWNFEQVTVNGSKVQVELNGTPILDADLSTVHDFMANHPHPGKDRTSGHFGFAGHNDPVRFRHIEIRKD